MYCDAYKNIKKEVLYSKTVRVMLFEIMFQKALDLVHGPR